MTLEITLDTDTHKLHVYKQDPEKLKIYTERKWRDEQLLLTDKFVVIPDSPVDYKVYREALRNYPQQVDFPNGERPTM